MARRQYITGDILRAILQKRCRVRGQARRIAERAGISEAYVSGMRAGHKPIAKSVGAELGYRRVTVWEKVW
jgi:hypothetical protein